MMPRPSDLVRDVDSNSRIAATILVGMVMSSTAFATPMCKTLAGECTQAGTSASECLCETPLGVLRGVVGTSEQPEANLISKAREEAPSITVQVFLKPSSSDPKNEAAVQTWIKQIAVSGVTYGHPTRGLERDPTNAILYTADVPLEAVRVMAVALSQLGVKIRSIEQYYPAPSNGFQSRANLIQLGSSGLNRHRQALSIPQIIADPLPLFGDLKKD